MKEEIMKEGLANNVNGSAVGFLTGALIGAGVALLLAPASGSETRRRIGQTARRLRNDVPEKARHIADRARSAFGAIEEGVSHGLKEARTPSNESR